MKDLNTNPPALKNLLRHLFERQGCSVDPRDILKADRSYRSPQLRSTGLEEPPPSPPAYLLSEPQGYSLDPGIFSIYR